VRRAALLAVVLSAASAACTPHDRFAREVTGGGDVDRGRMAIRQYGCQTCHVIPGVTGADALVGPPLHGMASRVYIGGILVNSSDNMIAWLKDPQAFEPRSAMPALGLTDQDARDITAYLYTLR
jgi:cytochrome c